MGIIKVNNSGSGFTRQKYIIFVLTVLSGVAIYSLMRTINTAAHGPKRIALYYKGAKRFNEESKAIYLKEIAGLWSYNLERMDGSRPIIKRDRLEIKENGIVWEVVEWTMDMPTDSVETFCNIRTAFISPYGISKGDTLSDVYILSQAFINGSDTCFGGYNYSELWRIKKRGDNLEIANRNYRTYAGDLSTFFPPGAVKLVENSEKQLYYDTIVEGVKETKLNSVRFIRKTDVNSGSVTLLPIRDSINGMDEYFRIKLEKSYSAANAAVWNDENIEDLLEKYYQPFIIDEKWRLFPRALPKTAQVRFVISTAGLVDSVQIQPFEASNRMFVTDLLDQIKSWRFPPHPSVLRINHSFIMP